MTTKSFPEKLETVGDFFDLREAMLSSLSRKDRKMASILGVALNPLVQRISETCGGKIERDFPLPDAIIQGCLALKEEIYDPAKKLSLRAPCRWGSFLTYQSIF